MALLVQVYDNGRQIVLNEIHGYLHTKIVSFLMNLHTAVRPIYMVRHGESEFNAKNLIGGGALLRHRSSVLSYDRAYPV